MTLLLPRVGMTLMLPKVGMTLMLSKVGMTLLLPRVGMTRLLPDVSLFACHSSFLPGFRDRQPYQALGQEVRPALDPPQGMFFSCS